MSTNSVSTLGEAALSAPRFPLHYLSRRHSHAFRETFGEFVEPTFQHLSSRTVVQMGALSSLACVVSLMLFAACSSGESTSTEHSSKRVAAHHASARAQLALPAKLHPDGEYTAQVSTWSETYRGPVKIAGDKVVSVYWPKWGHVSVTGGKLSGDFAEAVTSHGEMVRIEIEGQT